MAFDDLLADRLRWTLTAKSVKYTEKKMFGGIAFMVDEKMCLGINKEKLMARIDPEFYEEALKKEGCEPMAFTGRPMKGFVFILPEGIDKDSELEFWVDKCLEYNPKARSSKKKKKK